MVDAVILFLCRRSSVFNNINRLLLDLIAKFQKSYWLPKQFFEWLAPKAKVACQCQTVNPNSKFHQSEVRLSHDFLHSCLTRGSNRMMRQVHILRIRVMREFAMCFAVAGMIVCSGIFWTESTSGSHMEAVPPTSRILELYLPSHPQTPWRVLIGFVGRTECHEAGQDGIPAVCQAIHTARNAFVLHANDASQQQMCQVLDQS